VVLTENSGRINTEILDQCRLDAGALCDRQQAISDRQ
jgi:hypothetical protein